MKQRALSSMLVLAIGAIALTGCAGTQPAAAGPGPANPAGITAHGVGTAKGAPDTVTVVLGVQTQGASAKAALDANNEKAAALIAVLKGKGVADADLRTSRLSVNPTYHSSNGRISGYDVTNQVTATLHDVSAAGGLIDAAGAAAGDAVRVQQLSFSIDDDSALRAQARADAVKQAQAQAKQMAEAAGVRVGPLHSITETAAAAPGPRYDNALPADAARQVPVEAGSQELSVAVDVVYTIEQ